MHKSIVRLLKTENIAAAFYMPYDYGMRYVRATLEGMGYLTSHEDMAFYKFMHEAKEFLSGIVPAIHPMGCLFLQSSFFRRAVAEFGLENLNGRGGKSPTTVCRLYGSILSIVETYAEQAHSLRERDKFEHRKVKHSQKRRRLDVTGHRREVTEHVYETSFEDGWGVAEAAQRPGGEGTEPGVPPVTKTDIQKVLPDESDARCVLTYLRREGKLGHPRTRRCELAQEYRVNPSTIWRWCRKGQEIARRLLEERSLDLNDSE